MNRSVWPLWFLTKSKKADSKRGFRDRRKQTLFIDARKLGTLIDRVHRELTDVDLEKITSTYHAWRGVASTKNKKPGTKTPQLSFSPEGTTGASIHFAPLGLRTGRLPCFHGLTTGRAVHGLAPSSLTTFQNTLDSKSQWICVIYLRFLPLAPLRGEGVGG